MTCNFRNETGKRTVELRKECWFSGMPSTVEKQEWSPKGRKATRSTTAMLCHVVHVLVDFTSQNAIKYFARSAELLK